MKLAIAVALALAAITPAHAQYHGIIVPAFDGPQPLGQNVATNLYLQVWRTLRRAPYPNPARLDFGDGIARYSRDVFRPDGGEEVRRYAVDYAEVQLVLWGEVGSLGDGVLVQAFLAAPIEAAHPERRELWTIRNGQRSVSLDLPRRTFDFAPIVLDRELIEVFQSPDALRMCRRQAQPCDDLPVGSDWTAVRQSGPWAEVVTHPSNETGFVYLPTLDRLPNDISDFAAALLSYERGDFAQAGRLFSRVANREGSQNSTREDAAALAAIAKIRAGGDAGAELARLEAQYPESLYVFQASTMARLARALRAGGTARAAALRTIATAVRANEALFAPDDPWLRGIKSVLGDF